MVLIRCQTVATIDIDVDRLWDAMDIGKNSQKVSNGKRIEPSQKQGLAKWKCHIMVTLK